MPSSTLVTQLFSSLYEDYRTFPLAAPNFAAVDTPVGPFRKRDENAG
jgi:hypothetical protein